MSFAHLTLEDRMRIKEMLDAGASRSQIANELCKSVRTIFYEIKRGTINGSYDPKHAEEDRLTKLEKKGRPKAILDDNPVLAQVVSDCILAKKLSPKSIVDLLNEDPRFRGVIKSPNTIYKAIDDGLVPGVTRENLRPDTVKMFSGGHIMLPTWMRNEYGFSDGDRFFIEIFADGKVVLTKENS